MDQSISRREFIRCSSVIAGGTGLCLSGMVVCGGLTPCRASASTGSDARTEERADVVAGRSRLEARYRELIAKTGGALPEKRIGPEFPGSVAEWEAHASLLRANLMAALNVPNGGPELEARTVGRVELAGMFIEKVIYRAEAGSRVTANLYAPDRVRGRVPAFILCSGSNASKDVDFNQIMGQYLAGAGCLCLVPDTIGEGDRRIGGCHVEYVDEFVRLSRQLFGKLLLDLMRGVDYLLARPEVDPERIGTAGHSLGGGLAVNLAALDTRIRLSVPASPNFLYNQNDRPYWGAAGAQNPLGMGRVVGAPELAALVAPRLMLVVTADGDFADPVIIQKNVQIARRVYALYGKEGNLALHRVTDGSGHGPHFLSREAFQFISGHFGFPRLDRSRIDAAAMVKGAISWYPGVSILDLPRRVFPSVVPPHLKNASHCPDLDCLTAREALGPEYGTGGFLEAVRRSKKAALPEVETWEQWSGVRAKIVGSVRNALRLPSLARQPQPLQLDKTIEETSERVVKLVTLGLPPIEGYLLTAPSDKVMQKAIIYLHESRTKEGALSCPECTGFLGEGYQAVLLPDAVASQYGCNNDTYLGFCTTAVNVANVRLGVDYLAAEGFKQIAIKGMTDDIAILAAVTDDRITSVIDGLPAGTQPVSYVPRDWEWTYWEGTVPGIDVIADRAALLACVAPRPLSLCYQHLPAFTSKVYQLWEQRERPI